MAARLQRGTTPASCVTSTRIPVKTLPTFSNLSCPFTLNPFCTWCNMLLTWVDYSPVVSIPPPPFPQILPCSSFTSPLFFPLTYTWVIGNHNIIQAVEGPLNLKALPHFFLIHNLFLSHKQIWKYPENSETFREIEKSWFFYHPKFQSFSQLFLNYYKVCKYALWYIYVHIHGTLTI